VEQNTVDNTVTLDSKHLQ